VPRTGNNNSNVDEVNKSLSTGNQPQNTPETETGAQHGQFSKSTVLKEYPDCFNKLGHFPGEKHHIQLVDNPVPVVHPPRTIPVHILSLYKEELDKIIADNVITAVTEPKDWVNSVVCDDKENPDGRKKVRLCLNPKDPNKNIRREHYYT